VEVVGNGKQVVHAKNALMFRCLHYRFPQECGEIPASNDC
jgi:hypothetical protein